MGASDQYNMNQRSSDMGASMVGGSLSMLGDGVDNYQSSGGLGGVQVNNFDGRYSALSSGSLNRYSLSNPGLGLQGHDEFAMQNEDFPALPGAQGPGGSVGRGDDGLALGGHPFVSDLGVVGQGPGQQSMHGGAGQTVGQTLQGVAVQQQRLQQQLHQQQLQQLQQMQQPQQPQTLQQHQMLLQQQGLGRATQAESWKQEGAGHVGGARGVMSSAGLGQLDGINLDIPPVRQDGVSKEVQYGLGGLIEVIKMSDKDLSALALGVDLLTLGLNLNSQDCLYSLFSSPFTDHPANADTQFVTPQCYLMHPPQLKLEHFSKYKVETLFYMFYMAPHDIKQAYAAQELYRRDWRFHGELVLWLKARGPQELMQGHPTVQFQFFDVHTWEARLFTSAYRGNIVNGLLTEEDVRVKLQQPGPAQAT